MSLLIENQYLNGEYKKAKKNLKKFKKEHKFYHWFKVKKETLIIEEEENEKKSISYLKSEFDKIDQPNDRMILDMGNFLKTQKYDEAINYYTPIK